MEIEKFEQGDAIYEKNNVGRSGRVPGNPSSSGNILSWQGTCLAYQGSTSEADSGSELKAPNLEKP